MGDLHLLWMTVIHYIVLSLLVVKKKNLKLGPSVSDLPPCLSSSPSPAGLKTRNTGNGVVKSIASDCSLRWSVLFFTYSFYKRFLLALNEYFTLNRVLLKYKILKIKVLSKYKCMVLKCSLQFVFLRDLGYNMLTHIDPETLEGPSDNLMSL